MEWSGSVSLVIHGRPLRSGSSLPYSLNREYIAASMQSLLGSDGKPLRQREDVTSDARWTRQRVTAVDHLFVPLSGFRGITLDELEGGGCFERYITGDLFGIPYGSSDRGKVMNFFERLREVAERLSAGYEHQSSAAPTPGVPESFYEPHHFEIPRMPQ